MPIGGRPLPIKCLYVLNYWRFLGGEPLGMSQARRAFSWGVVGFGNMTNEKT